MEIIIRKFSDVDLNDSFFESLKADYPEFEVWFKSKSIEGKSAYVYYNDEGKLLDFLYLKIENGELDNVDPKQPIKKRLKVGTFKIDARGTRRGERFIKKIMDVAIYSDCDEIYLTIFPKHKALIGVFNEYGFEQKAIKRHEGKVDELVLIKDMRIIRNDVMKDYPKIQPIGKNKYVLSIYPKYHTKLFPDSILNNEMAVKYDLIKDISSTNSVHKIYLCFMPDVGILKRGDLIAIYRTNDYQGSAYYRSVITSICTVEELKTKRDFENVTDFISYTNQYSIFDPEELVTWFKKPNIFVIKMTYNIAFEKRVTRGYMIDELGINSSIYWGFFKLTDSQFKNLLEKGEANENYIVD